MAERISARTTWGWACKAGDSQMVTEDKTKSKSKRPNALKHGACSRIAILPGEDSDEFTELLEGLLAEWEPQGPTEGEAVYTIAACIWRKRRIQTFMAGKIGFRSLDRGTWSFDPDMVLNNLAAAVALDPNLLDRFLARFPDLKEKLANFRPENMPWGPLPGDLAFAQTIRLLAEELNQPVPKMVPALHLMRFANILGEDLFKQELAMEGDSTP